MAFDEGENVLPAVAHAAADTDEGEVRAALDAPGGQLGRLNLEELCRFVLGEENRVRYRSGAANLVGAQLSALPFIVCCISASMKVSL